jgi:putative restriction endonuclease
LFDRGYVTVTQDLRFEVSPRLKTEFENGRSYYQFNGARIQVPANRDDQPDARALEWHNERFLS